MSVGLPPRADTGCARCGARLEPDQEWCLECGAARTLIHSPPDWRVPFAVVGAVLALVAAGLILALIALSDDANQSAAAQFATSRQASRNPTTPARVSTAISAPARSTTPATSTAAGASAAIATWPAGLAGWTVVLASSKSHASADAAARRLDASGTRVGVLSSSAHPAMAGGYWIVFAGRYPTQAAAQSAATALRSGGSSSAQAKLVAPPGGI